MKIIALEGINASGKSTISKKICRSLRVAGKSCLCVDPSAYGPIGRAVRSTFVDTGFPVDPILDTILFSALRADGAQIILDRLKSDPCTTIILERWSLALAAYGTADGVRKELIMEMRRFLDELLSIDVTVLLDIGGELAVKRMATMDYRNRFERKGAEYFDTVGYWYRSYAKQDQKILVVDASGNPEMTFARVSELHILD